MEQLPSKNDDVELWRQDIHDPLDPGNAYAPTVFLASGERIGMSNCGWVMVYEVKDWMNAMNYYNRVFNSVDPNAR